MMYKIIRKFHFKNYVFFLSVLPGNAYWSVHRYDGSDKVSLNEVSLIFQKQHDIQVQAFIDEPQPAEFTDITIEDQTKIN